MTRDSTPSLACCNSAQLSAKDRDHFERQAAATRLSDPSFSRWAIGYGVIVHDALTQVRVHELANALVANGTVAHRQDVLELLMAADKLASAGMWLVAHMTYAQRVFVDGSALSTADFKTTPEGHTGGSLNMVPAYVGYLTANALSGLTRGWLMGQGHCVAAIDAVNVLVGNVHAEHASRYALDDVGLSRFVSDFYSYAITPDGRPASPLGSHVNASTAGGILEGGYLGFAELLYPHLSMPGERLVAFLSDGAFEEQRGSDWAPRWWRPSDCGLVAPIMVLNGRRIEQRSGIAQAGGERWLHQHLKLNGFDPVGIDGRDPASYVWGIIEIEERLKASATAFSEHRHDAIRMGYGIAEAPKGFGFPGAGSNRAHNLPLAGNPAIDPSARDEFNTAVRGLWVAPALRDEALLSVRTHARQARPLERDHPMAARTVPAPNLPEPQWRVVGDGTVESPMAMIDEYFLEVVRTNPQFRARVGNPDELRSNQLGKTLDQLKHRVLAPEPGVAEAVDGCVITELNEEAVVCAALGNKAGLNLVVTYEAFGMKMLGALRQEIIFARHLVQAGRPPNWLSVPIVLTSHTWENAKNEQSHQDPSLAEALLGEMADAARVLFPPDANTAAAMLHQLYRQRGRIAALVVPKRAVAHRFNGDAARSLADQGAVVVSGHPTQAAVILAATGAYQLEAALRAEARLVRHGVNVALIYVAEPARLRAPRDVHEAVWVVSDAVCEQWFPPGVPRVFLTHTRPEPYLGVLRRVDSGPKTTKALGYINRGGTLDVNGLLFANRCTWAHAVAAAAAVLGRAPSDFLGIEEVAAVNDQGDPSVLTREGRAS
jgi:phosphoketolase